MAEGFERARLHERSGPKVSGNIKMNLKDMFRILNDNACLAFKTQWIS